ncbi:hypothetical protein LQ567_06635 [Niabella pedocola]|uniref:Glycoside hydrolase family 42 N-terminal domain-containing protein n=1 Tax=Niabella pedocola TaxID=1752077 RepID=A0ABS8PQ37_9BACT|nr:hypothetical protein [Niabella pedocola]MCD2422432.1 hypothetical protein [Niabella pedocola]
MKIKKIIGIAMWLSLTFATHAAVVKDTLPRPFSIGIFYGPMPEMMNDEQFRWIKEANVDFIQFIGDSLFNFNKDAAVAERRNLQILDLAARYGLRYFVRDPRVRGSEAAIAAMVQAYKKHPGLGGYFIVDEPGKDDLDWPANAYKTILKYDPAGIPSVNLFPSFVYPDYEKAYVEAWVHKVGKEQLKLLSFDHYPLLANGSFGPAYFKNLDVIRRVGLQYGIATSMYPQSMGIVHAYRRPDSSELRYSAYTALAYGIKNLVWFTYNTPVGQPVERFTNAIIDSMGNKTDLYKPFRQLNADLKQLGKTVRWLDAIEVYHSDSLDGTAGLLIPDHFFWKPVDNGQRMILTHFKDSRTKQSFVMVVNKSLKSEAPFSFHVDKRIKKIYHVSARDGKQHTTRYKRGSVFTDVLLPGEGKLYALKENR